MDRLLLLVLMLGVGAGSASASEIGAETEHGWTAALNAARKESLRSAEAGQDLEAFRRDLRASLAASHDRFESAHGAAYREELRCEGILPGGCVRPGKPAESQAVRDAFHLCKQMSDDGCMDLLAMVAGSKTKRVTAAELAALLRHIKENVNSLEAGRKGQAAILEAAKPDYSAMSSASVRAVVAALISPEKADEVALDWMRAQLKDAGDPRTR